MAIEKYEVTINTEATGRQDKIEWRLNGQLHRTDGPAIEWADGNKRWYLNDKEYTFKNYRKQLLKLNLATDADVFILKLKYYE